MIYTSYFAMLRKLPANYTPISICVKPPSGYSGLEYKKLAPKYEILSQWKKDHDNEAYLQRFDKEVLSGKNPHHIVEELFSLLDEETKMWLEMYDCPPWENPDFHIVLICYEKPGNFCHRVYVGEWFSNHGIYVEEWSMEKKYDTKKYID